MPREGPSRNTDPSRGSASPKDWAAQVRRHGGDPERLPYAIRSMIANLAAGEGGDADIARLAAFGRHTGEGVSLRVTRVILPDSSGIPALQDLAALRDAVARAGGRPEAVSPAIPVDVVVDHSLIVDRAGDGAALAANMARELERNAERYRFLRWAEGAFDNLRVFPPGSGIIHQVNLEHLAQVIVHRDGRPGPEFVLGGDSHTTMVNALGVMGWGVGGLDAEAAALGLPYTFGLPEVVGVRLEGRLRPGVTTTDAVLTVTEVLRREGVTAAFVEFFGPGAAALGLAERATLANMAPEYGATMGFFAIDAGTIAYLAETRGPAMAEAVERDARALGLLRADAGASVAYPRVIGIDLSAVGASVAGPRRPQDRMDLAEVAGDFERRLSLPVAEGGFGRPAVEDGDGDVVIAAITSCTNTSNPRVMLAAGLLARNAVARGLRVPAHVKTSFAPGSRAVTAYLAAAGLMEPLEALGFDVVGYACTTCGGKSGPLAAAVEAAPAGERVLAAVLSGNRNFEGRIHRRVRANYILSPPLVVAYALAGSVRTDLTRAPLGQDAEGRPVMLSELWPDEAEIAALLPLSRGPELMAEAYGARLDEARALWARLEAPGGPRFPWDAGSEYLVAPPFFAPEGRLPPLPDRLEGARALGLYGDSLTTDHISPGGEIPPESPAGEYLIAAGIAQAGFNTYVGRRGNHHVMTRATFANLRIRNLLVPGREGWWTRHLPSGEVMTVFDCARRHAAEGVPMVVLAGRDYGMGSSRDWAAKGTALLGVRAVLAAGFERIHRANLVAMGVAPLLLPAGKDPGGLGLDGTESFTLEGFGAALAEGAPVRVLARHDSGRVLRFEGRLDVVTPAERALLAAGGMPRAVLERYGAVAEAGA